ncbi:hypothetical protein KY290_036546 [Solanum tuberosum]|uniref:Uncharacterized protein n=1 Tax=Solanum tuberosum TaxID=4113 RepID=A0ABQ7TTG1_SOLTU|nr:hypothetical protein KY285_035859 [Solanum tuberosum]KAH0737841.1 hypothetical protein KY290_036546 [Solanum tuberosum]
MVKTRATIVATQTPVRESEFEPTVTTLVRGGVMTRGRGRKPTKGRGKAIGPARDRAVTPPSVDDV